MSSLEDSLVRSNIVIDDSCISSDLHLVQRVTGEVSLLFSYHNQFVFRLR